MPLLRLLPAPAARLPGLRREAEFHRVGTQKVQEELEELFPGTPVLRMDTDTVTAARSHEAILEEFRRGRPLLVGTQMVAKGLDFENVTLVGVVLADQALFVDDFRAGERTFSLLTQVVGRAGRGEKTGRALIQTFTPEHDVLRSPPGRTTTAFTARRSSCGGCAGSRPSGTSSSSQPPA